MESAIKYVVVVTYGGKPNIIVANHSNQLEKMHRWLVQEKQGCSAFHILSAQRYVISAAGKVTATDVRIDFDEGGLRIYDKYDCLIDSCPLSEPEEQPLRQYTVRRSETWVNETKVWAESEDAAIQKVEQDMYDGGFDVMDGWCDDANTYIVE